MSKILYSRAEAAEYLGLAKTTLAVWACKNRNHLPFIKLGRSVRYHIDDLEAFIKRNRYASAAAPC